jgi:hypothetical protein
MKGYVPGFDVRRSYLRVERNAVHITASTSRTAGAGPSGTERLSPVVSLT